jgi:SAM-dependent methyltransferase
MPESAVQGPTLQGLLAVYKVLFDRDLGQSEAEDVVRRGSDWSSARKAIFATSEFKQLLYRSSIPRLTDPAIVVQTKADTAELEEMFARIEATFTKEGGSEPYWTVLKSDKFKLTNLSENRGRFFEQGRLEADLLVHFASRAGIDLSSFSSCFELGCGVGRVTAHLAKMFAHVTGWDISEPMIAEASRNLQEFGCDNVTLHAIKKFSEFEALEQFDCFLSRIVLQHNPPPVAYYILSNILDKMRPGGVAFFQLHTYRLGYQFDVKAYLSEPRKDLIEMHALPQRSVFELLENKRCRLLEIREDALSGPSRQNISNTFFVQKCP